MFAKKVSEKANIENLLETQTLSQQSLWLILLLGFINQNHKYLLNFPYNLRFLSKMYLD